LCAAVFGMSGGPLRLVRVGGDGRGAREFRASGLLRLSTTYFLPFAPFWIVLERKEALNGLGAARAWFQEGLQGLAQLGEAAVGGFAGAPWGAVEAVEGRGDVKDPASCLQEVAIEHFRRVSRVCHARPLSQSGRNILSDRRLIFHDLPKSPEPTQIAGFAGGLLVF